MKIAPIMRELKNPEYGVSACLLHTGQHYDTAMKQSFFEQLEIPEPDMDLGVGSGSHAQQTAEIMKRFEPILDELKPAAVLVVGDVNSTIACALVAAKKSVPVLHVEAGLRSGDRSMPEEINRILTDQLSELLFITERTAEGNLLREGITADKIKFCGNVMIDSLYYNLSKAIDARLILDEFDVERYGLVTLHRPSNVDDAVTLERLLDTLLSISRELPLVLPLHPRTQRVIEDFGFSDYLDSPNLIALPPQGYFEMLGLMKDAEVVLTDSGGIQEETTALGVPCLTLRENTERPITLVQGTNTLVGSDPEKIRGCFDELMRGGGKAGRVPEYWDGAAAPRIAEHLQRWAHRS